MKKTTKTNRKPDYTRSFGGHFAGSTCLENIPTPHYRMWPKSPQRRPVSIKVYTWKGMSLGAIHWYAEIKEAYNDIWDPRTEKERAPKWYEETKSRLGSEPTDPMWTNPIGWVELGRDRDGEGRQFEARDIVTELEAWYYVGTIVRRHFNNLDKYVFKVRSPADRTRLTDLVRTLKKAKLLQVETQYEEDD